MKKALITGITGQDGSYLAELLLRKGYEVHGIKRRSSLLNTDRIDHLYQDPHDLGRRLILHYGDMTDTSSLTRGLQSVQPDEIYNLAAQSHVGESFEKVVETCHATGLATLQILEMTRKLPKPAKFFYASSSEIFGSPEIAPQDEFTHLNPITPYGAAKAFGTQMVRIYRKNFGIFAVNGILFNHESPRRGENFVTRKICRAVAAIKAGRQSELLLGDTSAQRDWGQAREFVRGMWLAMQYDTPEDFVFATGKLHRVQEIIEIAFGAVELDWRKFVRQEKTLFRAADPCQVIGNPAKAKKYLGWENQISFEQTIGEMVLAELREQT